MAPYVIPYLMTEACFWLKFAFHWDTRRTVDISDFHSHILRQFFILQILYTPKKMSFQIFCSFVWTGGQFRSMNYKTDWNSLSLLLLILQRLLWVTWPNTWKALKRPEQMCKQQSTFRTLSNIYDGAFFLSRFLSQPFTNQRTAGEGGGHFFNFHPLHRHLGIIRAITAQS